MNTERGYGERYFITFFVHGINGKIEVFYTLKLSALTVSKDLKQAPISDGRNYLF